MLIGIDHLIFTLLFSSYAKKFLYICRNNYTITMKNCIAFLFIISQVFIMHAQSLVVTGDAVVYGDPLIDITSHLTVKNVSGQSLNVICEKNVISQPQGASNHFCWGGTCYGASTIISPDFTTIASGQASTEFAGHFMTLPCMAKLTYRKLYHSHEN